MPAKQNARVTSRNALTSLPFKDIDPPAADGRITACERNPPACELIEFRPSRDGRHMHQELPRRRRTRRENRLIWEWLRIPLLVNAWYRNANNCCEEKPQRGQDGNRKSNARVHQRGKEHHSKTQNDAATTYSRHWPTIRQAG